MRKNKLPETDCPAANVTGNNANGGNNGYSNNSGYDNNGGYGNNSGNGNVTGLTRSERERRAQDLAAVARSQRTPAALFDDLNWEYATVERLNPDLSTQVIPFNLGNAILHGGDADNIALKAGDVVTIYSQKDIRGPTSKQTRLVSLEGEVNAPGVYQLQPGETLRMLLTRAGGFTAQAYVYGLEFSREETRQRQRDNLVAAIARLEALSAVQAARDAANRRDDAGALSTTAVRF